MHMLQPAQSALLDWTRGLAAQAVLIGHVITASDAESRILIQDAGVVMFFVLSGFLIAHSTLRKAGAYTFTEYFCDRASRIFVPYVPAVIFIILAGIVFSLPGPYDPVTALANLAMLQDFPLYRYVSFPEFERIGTGRPLWSVAMEWWFYMAFALVAFRRPPLWSWPLLIIGAFIAAFNFTVGVLAFTWTLGALGALLFARLPRAPWLLISIGLISLAGYRYAISTDQFYDLSVNLLVGAAFVAALKAVENWQLPSLVSSIGAGMAAFSYTLYLIHYPFKYITPGWQAIVWANVVAVVFWWLFERHHKAIARRLKAIISRRESHGELAPSA